MARWLTYSAAAAIPLSIAGSQILLALALAAVLISGEKLRFPPVKLPLALFFSQTVLALLLSGDGRAGLPQIRKFYLFGMLLVVATTFHTARQVRNLVLIWTAGMCLSAGWGFVQFYHRYRLAVVEHAQNYGFYLDDRMTGFAGHWMTLGGEEMIVALMLMGLLLFGGAPRWKVAAWTALAVLLVSMVMGLTRCIFLLGFPAGAAYLVWSWKRWAVVAMPIVALAAYGVAPATVRERVESVVRPHGGTDSNEQRAVTRRVGWEIIRAHPWFGLGPEQVGRQFDRYVPADIPRPLPPGWYGHLHNIYLQYAAERGLAATLLLLWWMGRMLWDFQTALRKPHLDGAARAVLRGAIAVIVAVMAEGLLEHNLGDSEVLMFFLAVAAGGYVAARTGACARTSFSTE